MTSPQAGSAPGNAAYWEHFEHTADAGIRGVGRTQAEAFEQAALALTALIVEPERITARSEVRFHCADAEPSLLLFDFIEALVNQMAGRRMVFGRFHVAIGDGGLQAQAWGEPLDRVRHAPAVEVKGATMTELHVRRRPDGLWEAQCVVDV